MILFLTSSGFDNKTLADHFIQKLPKQPKECSVLMIAYAQTPEEQAYVDLSKQELIGLGISNIKLFNLKEEKFESIENFNVTYVCGGNTFAILDRMQKIGIDKFIKTKVKENGALYVGVSAGSIIAGPTIEIAGWGTEGDLNEVKLNDLSGFEFTDHAIFPHFKKELTEEVASFKTQASYPVTELYDGEALLIDKNRTQKISL